MEIKVQLIQVLPLQSGEGKNGPWKKQDIIVETLNRQYPKKICVSIWGDKIDDSILKIGNQLNVAFDIESREYNGRWYTDVRAWKIDLLQSQQSDEPLPPIDYEAEEDNPDDDLPF